MLHLRFIYFNVSKFYFERKKFVKNFGTLINDIHVQVCI